MRSEARAWETSTHPERMLEMCPTSSDRKCRLLLVACCLACESVLPRDSRYTVLVGQRYADGLADHDDLEGARFLADDAWATANAHHQHFAAELQRDEEMWALGEAGADPAEALYDRYQLQGRAVRAALVARATVRPRLVADDLRHAVGLPDRDVTTAILRDIFRHYFYPVAFDPAWRTDTAVAIARGMYESRDFSAMPILADALQDAGCENADILTHCRDEKQPHVRGCWVVDLVLGKS